MSSKFYWHWSSFSYMGFGEVFKERKKKVLVLKRYRCSVICLLRRGVTVCLFDLICYVGWGFFCKEKKENAVKHFMAQYSDSYLSYITAWVVRSTEMFKIQPISNGARPSTLWVTVVRSTWLSPCSPNGYSFKNRWNFRMNKIHALV